MAERYTREEAPLVIHPTEANINEHFNKLIYRLNQRREEMIHQFSERRAAVTTRKNMLQQLIDSKAEIQGRMKENPLHSMLERTTEEIDTKMRDLQVTQKETEVVFECDTTQLEQTISVLGQLVEREIFSTPDYPALQQPSISVAKLGTAEGELYFPNKVAFNEKSQIIYITNAVFGVSNISVFSVTGEYIDRVCVRQFHFQVSLPSGIAISGDNAFVSDTMLHCVFKFKFPTFISVSKVGKKGTGVGKFRVPCNLTVADGYVYVADRDNNRIAVMSTGLQHSNYITHQTMTRPHDVKVYNNQLYIMSDTGSPCLHVFSLTGEKIRSLITRDEDGNAQVRRCYSFCLDKKLNILMADHGAHNIKVFSQEGALLHTLGNTQDGDKTITPCGIALTDNNKIICTSSGTNFLLHIF